MHSVEEYRGEGHIARDSYVSWLVYMEQNQLARAIMDTELLSGCTPTSCEYTQS